MILALRQGVTTPGSGIRSGRGESRPGRIPMQGSRVRSPEQQGLLRHVRIAGYW